MSKEKYNRDNLGLIDLSQYIHNVSDNTFYIGNNMYYYKICNNVDSLYNELIVEELAHQFGIPCAHYDIGFIDDTVIIFSKDVVKKNEKSINIEKLMFEIYPDEFNIDKRNNLEDLWNAFYFKYKDNNIVKKLMDQLVNIFIFDILIGNSDRYYFNYLLLEKENDVNIGPIIDNENMLNQNAIYYGGYDISVSYEDYFYCAQHLNEEDNFLLKFLDVSDVSYREIIENNLFLIEEENINNIFKLIENKIGCRISPFIKKKILDNFKINRNMIKNILKKNKVKIIS